MAKVKKKSEEEMLIEEANKDNVNAIYNLGYIYLLGQGVEENPQKAVQYFRRGTAYHDGKCMQALAMCYKNGDGVEKDLTKMIYWLNNGVKINDPGCMYQLALCYEMGEVVEEDLDKAIAYMKQANTKEAKKWLKRHGQKNGGYFCRFFGGKK